MPEASIAIPRPQRWDVPYDPDMTDANVDRVLSVEPFASIDPNRFPAATPLREIIRNDCRIVTFVDGDIIVRSGDYGSSLFFIMDGSVRVILDSLAPELLGRRDAPRKTIFSAVAQLWTNRRTAEYRSVDRQKLTKSATHGEGKQTRVFLQDVPAILKAHESAEIGQGGIFGELAALARIPRTATVIADGPCELLELRWQGFRDIRRRADELRKHVDNLYRERSLINHLQSTPIFSHLDQAQLEEVARQTEFEMYGEFDWYAAYNRIADDDPAKRLAHEPVIAREGDYPNGVIMIRTGFARISRRYGNGERTISYLGRGRTFGFEEITLNTQSSAQVPLQATLRAVGYVDILRVPTAVIERYALVPRAAETPRHEARVDTGTLEFLVENRFINGTAAMMIDMNRCTRCDDCVRACAATHDNNPRFLRHGPIFGHHMVANACMHCADPVCMIGCPTGAIHRDPFGGQVVINDDTCIGCATRANACPYDNIRMVDIRDEENAFILDENTNTPIQKATKCDLCGDQLGGPACQRACPHDALSRMDMDDDEHLAKWLNR